MAKFLKSQLSAISQIVFSKMKQGSYVAVIAVQSFQNVFSKTSHSFRIFRKFCHSKISTYLVVASTHMATRTYVQLHI